MEDLIKTEFASPIIFDSLDTSAGYYYQSSAESSPSMFESSPDQSPSSIDFYQNYSPSFECNQQNFMSCIDTSSQYQLCQPQEFVYSNEPIKTFASGMNQNPFASANGNVMLNGEQIKSQTTLSELTKLFNLSEKAEDKIAVQSKIKQILFEHLNTKSQVESVSQLSQPGSALITPPLSPNADNLLFVGNKTPVFGKNYAPQMVQQVPTGIKSPQSGHLTLSSMTHSMLKAEPTMHPISAGQQHAIRRQLSPYLSALDSTAASNVISLDNLAGQSPVAINSMPANANNSTQNSVPNKIYYETSSAAGPMVNQSMSPVYGYKVESDPLPSMALLANDPSAVQLLDPRSSSPAVVEPKKSGRAKSSKAKKGKGKSSDGEQAKQGGMCGIPKQSQKRSAHLSAEFRYRTKLNDKISKLRSLVGQKVHLSKSAVLTRSIERIVKLQKLTIRLHESNLRLQNLVAKYSANQQMSSQMMTPQENSSPTKLMSIKELTKSLSVGNSRAIVPTSPPPAAVEQQVVDINKFLEQHSLMEPEQPILESGLMFQANESTAEVFNLDQLLDQF